VRLRKETSKTQIECLQLNTIVQSVHVHVGRCDGQIRVFAIEARMRSMWSDAAGVVHAVTFGYLMHWWVSCSNYNDNFVLR